MRIKRLAATGSMALALAGAGLVTATPANAAISCNYGMACLHYNSNFEGAILNQQYAISNYDGYRFSASVYDNGGSGAGSGVKNNAASVQNNDPNFAFRVYYNSNFNGTYAQQTIMGWDAANLNATMKNNNASGQFLD